MIKNEILEETDVTPEPVGGQSVDKGVEEGEDNVWVMVVTLVLWLIFRYCWLVTVSHPHESQDDFNPRHTHGGQCHYQSEKMHMCM